MVNLGDKKINHGQRKVEPACGKDDDARAGAVNTSDRATLDVRQWYFAVSDVHFYKLYLLDAYIGSEHTIPQKPVARFYIQRNSKSDSIY